MDTYSRAGFGRAAPRRYPTRPRAALVADAAARYGPDADGFELLVLPEAFDTLAAATATAKPAEALGLLVGRVYADAAGPYTLVSDAVAVPADRAGPGGVMVSGQAIQHLKRLAERRHPTADLVGWWHSHGTRSEYSPTDRAEQATWPSPEHVGLLAFMDESSPPGAWRGPEARPLAHRGGAGPHRPPLEQRPPAARPDAAHRPRRHTAGLVLGGLGALALFGAGALFGRSAFAAALAPPPSAGPGSGPGDSRQAASSGKMAVEDALDGALIDCRAFRIDVVCHGPTGRGVAAWYWRLDGRPVDGDGPDLVISGDVNSGDVNSGDVNGGDVDGGDVNSGDVNGGDVNGGAAVRTVGLVVAGADRSVELPGRNVWVGAGELPADLPSERDDSIEPPPRHR